MAILRVCRSILARHGSAARFRLETGSRRALAYIFGMAFPFSAGHLDMCSDTDRALICSYILINMRYSRECGQELIINMAARWGGGRNER